MAPHHNLPVGFSELVGGQGEETEVRQRFAFGQTPVPKSSFWMSEHTVEKMNASLAIFLFIT